MNSKAKGLWHIAGRLICFALVLCMLAGMLPAYAAEVTDETAAETPEEKPATVDIVVAKKDIPQGTYITDDYIQVVTVPNYNIPSNTMSDITAVMTKYSKTDIYEGEYIYAAQISPNKQDKVSNDAMVQDIIESNDKYLVVTDYVLPNTGKDLAALLQKLIEQNPKRTIYFPDGEYVISSTLKTSAAGPTSCSLQLADGAVIKADSKWQKKDGYNSLISLGGLQHMNDINVIGSYYSLIGGTLDGNGKAYGVSIDSGRETLVRNVCIKNAVRGIFVNHGANHVSSDADIEDVTIIGNGDFGSYGMYFIGYDNTITNVRIYNVQTGVYSIGGGNFFKNVQVFNDPEAFKLQDMAIGFKETNRNWYSQCHAENCVTAFDILSASIMSDCSARWTSDKCTKQYAINIDAPKMSINGFRAEFYGEAADTAFLKTNSEVKNAIISGCIFDEELEDSKLYKDLLHTPILPVSTVD